MVIHTELNSMAAPAPSAIAMQLLFRHTNLFHYFPTMTKALEALFVLEGIKPAAQQLIHDDDLAKVEGFCRNMKLGFSCSPAGNNWHLAMLGENQETADHALFYSHIGNHTRLGESLGYPSCCIQNYLQHIRKVASEEEYALLTPKHESRAPFLMNYLLRPHDLALLSHVPCSFFCSPSMQQASRAYASLQKRNPALAQFVMDNLRGPLVVHEHTAHPLRGYSVVGTDIYYQHALTSRESYMHDVFARCNKVQVVNHDHLRLCQGEQVVDEIKGDHVRFLFFE